MKRFIFISLVLTLFLTNFASFAAPGFEFLWDDEIKIKKGDEIKTPLLFNIPNGLFLYAKKTDLEFQTLEGINVLDVSYPVPSLLTDPLDGSMVNVYEGEGEIIVRLMAPEGLGDGTYEVSADLHYQGCSKKACFKPATKLIVWKVEVGGVTDGKETLTSGLDVKYNSMYIIAFLGGVLSSFTPCILPLIPITLLIIGVKKGRRFSKNIALSVSLVVGMSLTYAALGLAAAYLGKSLGFLFQSKIFLWLVIVFLFAMAFSLLGLFTLELPKGVRNFLSRLGGGGVLGAFLSGASMGLLATPCLGPIVASLLVYAGTTGNLFSGFLALMLYGLGLGTVIIIVGTGYGTVTAGLKKTNVRRVKKFIGLLLLVPALYYLNGAFPFTHFFTDGSHPAIDWKTPSESALTGGEKPKMIFFTADWCLPCKIFGFTTLRKGAVRDLSQNFETIRVDATNSTIDVTRLLNRYKVLGYPTVVFTSPKGKVYSDLTYGGEGKLEIKMEKALEKSRSEK